MLDHMIDSFTEHDVTYRPLSQDDVDMALRLHKFAKFGGQLVFGHEYRRDLEELISSAGVQEDDVFGLVAEVDGEVVGVVTCQQDEPSEVPPAPPPPQEIQERHEGGEEGRAACVLLTLVVRADMRCLGVGGRLLELAAKVARDRG